jgi:hypothetical protein
LDERAALPAGSGKPVWKQIAAGVKAIASSLFYPDLRIQPTAALLWNSSYPEAPPELQLRPPSPQSGDQRNRKKYKKDKEKKFCNACGGYSNAKKAEDSGNDRNDKKNSSPVKHNNLLWSTVQPSYHSFYFNLTTREIESQ